MREEEAFGSKRAEIFDLLKHAYKETLTDPESMEVIKRRFCLEALTPTLKGAFYIYDSLREQVYDSPSALRDSGNFILPDAIMSLHPGLDIAHMTEYLSFLERTGLLEKTKKGYRPARMYRDIFGSQLERVKSLMDDMEIKLDEVDISRFTTKKMVSHLELDY